MPHPEVVYGGTVRPPLPQAVTASGRQGHQISARFWKGHGGVGTRGSRKGRCWRECEMLGTSLLNNVTLPASFEYRVEGRLEPPLALRSEERREGKERVSTCRNRWTPVPKKQQKQ